MHAYLLCFFLIFVASPAVAEQFSKLEQKVYLQQCVGDDEKMKDYCSCTLDEMQRRMTLKEFRALGELKEGEIMDNEKFTDSVMACSSKIKR